MKKALLLTFVCSCIASISYAQDLKESHALWNQVNESSITLQGERRVAPDKFSTYHLNVTTLEKVLVEDSEIDIPMPDGKMMTFVFEVSNVMHPELAARYPEIKMFSGHAVGSKSTTIKFDLTVHGFHAMILMPGQSILIEPYSTQDKEHYISFYRSDWKTSAQNFSCGGAFAAATETPSNDKPIPESLRTGGNLRTYRLAVATTGEYTAAHGGTVVGALSGIATTMNRVNGIYERDVAISMQLIASNDTIIFTDGTTDPFINGNPSALINVNQQVIDSIIGDANYDIGHNFNTGGGGLAQLRAPCKSGQKARAVTGLSQPFGDVFDVDYVCHEMGHSWGASHTFNSNAGACLTNISNGSAYEPGSGSTIMAYTGICSPHNVVNDSDPYFHRRSLDQMIDYSTNNSGDACAVKTALNNSAPTIDSVNLNYAIPIKTPFILSASAHDIDGDTITYCWEEWDLGPQGAPNSPSGTAPIFRTFLPTTDSFRIFPRMDDIVNNSQTMGEIMASYGRDLNFRVTVRDNRLGGGCIKDSLVELTVDGNSGPFKVTLPNNHVYWTEGTAETVTWDVANTDVSPVSCSTVNILFSSDGGWTYPTVLASNTANDGSESITVPMLPGTTNRIKIEAADNIFFDISNKDFTIVDDSVIDYIFTVTPSRYIVCNEDTASFQVHLQKLGSYSDSVDITYTGLPSGAAAVFSNSLDSITAFPTHMDRLSFSGLNSIGKGRYPITLTATDDSITYTETIQLIIPGVPDSLPGNAISMTGNNFIEISDMNFAPETFTVEWWLYPVNYQNFNQSIGPGWDKFLFHTTSDGSVFVGTDVATRFTDTDLGAGTVELFTWNHFAFVYDGGDARFYKNGVLLASSAYMTPPEEWGTFYLGMNNFNSIRGQLDEVRIWEVARTASEIRSNMHLSLGDCEQGLLAYYQFNNNSGDVEDIISSYDGVINGAVRVAASVPFGPGVAVTATEASGTVNFANAGIAADYSVENGATVVVSKIKLSPNDSLGIVANSELFDAQYWAVHSYGGGGFKADLTYEPTDSVTAADEQIPIQLLLYARNATSDSSWHFVDNASSASATGNTVTFSNLEEYNQFILVRALGPVISTEEIDLSFCLTAVDGTSSSVSYEVQGANLTADLVIKAPPGFEISLFSDSAFVNSTDSLSITPSAGVVPKTPIYIRFAPAYDSTYSGTLTHTSMDAFQRDINVTATPVGKLPGNSIVLDGDDQITSDGLFINSNTVTMSAWIKPLGPQQNWAGIIFSRGDGTTAGLSITDQNMIRYHWNGGGWPYETNLFAIDSQWNHVALVITPNDATVYVNGIPSTNATPQNPEEFQGTFRIGRDPCCGERFFTGEIEEVKVWTRAFTTQELRESMHLTLEDCDDDLVLYYQFNVDSGAVQDLAGDHLGLLEGDPQRMISTAPVGMGSANTQMETIGGVSFFPTGIQATFLYHNSAEVVSSRIANAPYGSDGIIAGETILDNQYWAVNRFGTDSFAADLLFYVSEDLSSFEESKPDEIALYGRYSRSDTSWKFLGRAESVIAAADAATFKGITAFEQFVLSRANTQPTYIDEKKPSGISIYPNPTHAEIYIEVLDRKSESSITIYNVLGEEVGRLTDSNDNVYQFTLPSTNGLYLVKVSYEDGSEEIVKVVVGR